MHIVPGTQKLVRTDSKHDCCISCLLKTADDADFQKWVAEKMIVKPSKINT